jgi:hypothetical protein
VVAYTMRRELTRASAHGQDPLHFPLRRFRRKLRTCSMSKLFGADTVAPTSEWAVPTEPDIDCLSVAPLPEVRRAAERLVSRTRPLDRLEPVTAPISLPWRNGMTPPPGRWQWGPKGSVKHLPLDQRQTWRKLIEKEVAVGALEIVTDINHVRLVTPPFIAYHPVSLKARLVHDLRPLNARLHIATTKYESIRDALLHDRRLGTKLDLAMAFKHVPLSAEASSMMIFAVDGVLFRWLRLPFGMSWSPSMFSAALKPVIDALRKEGVRCVVYVDDILILADTVSRLDADTARTMELLEKAGWRVSPEKTYPFAHDRIVFLGLLLDLRDSTAHVPVHKALKLRDLVSKALENTNVTLSHLQKVLGLLSFFLVAVPTIGLAWRAIVEATVEASRNPGRHVKVTGGLELELRFWKDVAQGLPSWPTMKYHAVPDWYLITDASDVGSGALWWKGDRPAPSFEAWQAGKLGAAPLEGSEAFPFLDDHAAQSSAFRELIGLWRALWKRFGKPGDKIWDASCSPGLATKQVASFTLARAADMPTVLIDWTSDSSAGVGALGRWRSRSPAMHRIILAIASFCIAKNIAVSAKWVSRDHGWLPVADFLSRTVGRAASAEWSIPRTVFESWRQGFTPSADMFATRKNKLTTAFYSQHPEEESLGNALSARWPQESYAYPPFSLIPHAIAQWKFTTVAGAQALFILPDLPGLHLLLEDVQVLRREVFPKEARLIDSLGQPASEPPPVPIFAYLLRR